jgi:hypothetical protein
MYAYAWYAWMQYVRTNGWILRWVAETGEPFGSWLYFWVTNINQYEGQDDTSRHL